MEEIVISGSETFINFLYDGDTYRYWCKKNSSGEIKIEVIHQMHGIYEGIEVYDRDRKSYNSKFGKEIYKAFKKSGNI